MTLVLSRYGFTPPLRQLQLRRCAARRVCGQRRCYNPYYLHPAQPHDALAVEEDTSAEDHAIQGIDDLCEPASSPSASETPQDVLRQQLELRSPVDALRRRFYGPTARVRSYLITKQLMRDIEAEQDLDQNGNPRADDEEVDAAQDVVEEEAKPGEEDVSAAAGGPDALRDLLRRQLDACRSPADAMRVYTVAFRRAACIDALQSIPLDPDNTSTWFHRFRNMRAVLPALGVVVRRFVARDGTLRGHAPQLLVAALGAAGRLGNYDALLNLIDVWNREVDWPRADADPAPLRQRALDTLLGGLIAGLRRHRRSFVGDPFAQDAAARDRLQTVLQALTQDDDHKDSAHALTIDPAQLLAAPDASFSNYIHLLGFTRSLAPLQAAERLYLSHANHTSWPTAPTAHTAAHKTLAYAFSEAHFRAGAAPHAWVVLHSIALDLSSAPRHLPVFLGAQDDAPLTAPDGLLAASPPPLREHWASERARHRAALASVALDPLLGALRRIELRLGLDWDPAAAQHVMSEDLRRAWSCARDAPPGPLPRLLVAELGEYGEAVVDVAARRVDEEMRAVCETRDGAEFEAWLEKRERSDAHEIVEALDEARA